MLTVKQWIAHTVRTGAKDLPEIEKYGLASHIRESFVLINTIIGNKKDERRRDPKYYTKP